MFDVRCATKMLTTSEIIRAWKDRVYRESLTAEEKAALPPHPAGEIRFSEWPAK
jgi:mersacidin/lichenicidin family type 2 lantibiotic